MIYEAYMLAVRHHKGQMYGKVPYIEHLSAVVNSLYKSYAGECPDVVLATGWLHDILEDTPCDTSEILHECGPKVLGAVIALTKGHGQPYSQYIAEVRSNPIALEVKRHDTLCNLTASIMSGENGRIKKYAKQLQLLVGE